MRPEPDGFEPVDLLPTFTDHQVVNTVCAALSVVGVAFAWWAWTYFIKPIRP